MSQKVVCTVTVKKNAGTDNSNPLGTAIAFEADTLAAAAALCKAEAVLRGAASDAANVVVQAAVAAIVA